MCRKPRRLAGGKGGETRVAREPKNPNRRVARGLAPTPGGKGLLPGPAAASRAPPREERPEVSLPPSPSCALCMQRGRFAGAPTFPAAEGMTAPALYARWTAASSSPGPAACVIAWQLKVNTPCEGLREDVLSLSLAADFYCN